jgi:hypothetical protein
MKKYLLILFLLVLAFSAKSQVLISILLGDKLNSDKLEFGLDGGLNWSTIHGLQGASNHTGFDLGFYFDFKFNNPAWMLNTGVIVKSPMGADDLPVYSLKNAELDSSFTGGRVSRKVRYFNVPVMIKYMFETRFFLEGGAQLGLRANAYDEFTNKVIDKNDLKYKLNTKDQYRPLDAGFSAGFGYRFMKGNGMKLDLRYYFGLVDIVIDQASPPQYNRVLYLSMGIPIGKSKKNKSK